MDPCFPILSATGSALLPAYAGETSKVKQPGFAWLVSSSKLLPTCPFASHGWQTTGQLA
jgi:hypothetical protein